MPFESREAIGDIALSSLRSVCAVASARRFPMHLGITVTSAPQLARTPATDRERIARELYREILRWCPGLKLDSNSSSRRIADPKRDILNDTARASAR